MRCLFFYIFFGTDCPAILIETFFCDNQSDYDIAKRVGYEGIAMLMAEGILKKTISGNVTEDKKYTNAIVYSGDRDKAIAIIIKEYLPNSTIIDIADYKGHTTENVYTVGGGASAGIDKFGGHVTKFVGKNFKETYKLVVSWLKDRKYYKSSKSQNWALFVKNSIIFYKNCPILINLFVFFVERRFIKRKITNM